MIRFQIRSPYFMRAPGLDHRLALSTQTVDRNRIGLSVHEHLTRTAFSLLPTTESLSLGRPCCTLCQVPDLASKLPMNRTTLLHASLKSQINQPYIGSIDTRHNLALNPSQTQPAQKRNMILLGLRELLEGGEPPPRVLEKI